jgi:hypothetical protein
MDEPNLRTCLVHSLNGSFAGGATAETFNGRGKTDILVRSRDRNVFLGECKIYNGKAGVVDAIDQLLGYATWRDGDLGLIIFVRNRALSSAILALRTAADENEHVLAIRELDEHGTELALEAIWPGDPDRRVRIWALLVHLPLPHGRRPRRPSEVLSVEDAMEALLDIQRTLPSDRGIAYSPTLGPTDPRDTAPGPWRVRMQRQTPDGIAGIEATPKTPDAATEHRPEGAFVVDDIDTARRVSAELRRTQRDLVPADLSNLRIRFDRLPAALRDAADRLERADPAYVTATFGPRGLWQCQLAFETDRGTLQVPMAFAAGDPPEGWDIAVRATLFDVAVRLCLRRTDHDAKVDWKLEASDSPPRERLVALDFLYVASGRGTLRWTSIDPAAGDQDFDLAGFELDEVIMFERELLTNVVALEDYLGEPVDLPDTLDQGHVNELFTAGTAVRTSTAVVLVDNVVVVAPNSREVPAVGDEIEYHGPVPADMELLGRPLRLGTGEGTFRGRVERVEPQRVGPPRLGLVPADEDARKVEIVGLRNDGDEIADRD